MDRGSMYRPILHGLDHPVTSKCEIPSVGRRDLGEANVRPLAWGEVGFQPNVGKPGITAHQMWTLTLALAPKLWHS